MGGIIVWPKDSDPSTSSNIWLECNGQSFDTGRFPKLYKVLGSNKVPNFQGMFLRGAGSQSYTQNNGLNNFGNTSTIHSSGTVGEIQGDASREMTATTHSLLLAFENRYPLYDIPSYHAGSVGWYSYGGTNCWGLLYSGGQNIYGEIDHPKRIKFVYNPKHYRYSLSGSGGDYAYYSLNERSISADGDEYWDVNFYANEMGFSNSLVMPVGNEIRPVNIAVKYYIRAK